MMILAPVILAAAAWTMDGGDIEPKPTIMHIEERIPLYVPSDEPGVKEDPTLPAPPEAEKIPGMELEISAGGVGAFTSGEDGAVKPFVRLKTVTPLPILDEKQSQWWPRGYVVADFTGLPGRSVVLSDLNTYNSVEVRLGIAQTCFQNEFQRLGLYAEGGFATRLQGSETEPPLNRTVRWGGGGISIEQKEGKAWVHLGLIGDQRITADFSYAPAVQVAGSVRIWTEDKGALAKVGVSISGEAILGLASGYLSGETRRDIVRIGFTLSR